MTIVSISLNDEILNEMDKLQKSLGFSGRSEIVRAGIRGMISEERFGRTWLDTFTQYYWLFITKLLMTK